MHRAAVLPGLRRRGVLRPALCAAVVVLMIGSSWAAVTLGALAPLGTGPVAGSGAGPPGGSSGVVTAATSAALTVYPTEGVVGTSVTFNATHFGVTKKITISSASGTVCSGVTTSKGVFSCTYTIPPTPGGADKFTAENGGGLTSTATFTVVPRLVVLPTSGPIGTVALFAGTGFSAKATVDVNWTAPAGASVVACTGTADSSGNGSFSCTFTVPASPGGGHTFGASAGAAYTASVKFTVLPQLVAAPGFGPAGSTVTFTGTGFGATTNVAVSWVDGPACSGPTLDTGSFDCSYPIPSTTAGGYYNFSAMDGSGNSATVPFVVTYLHVSPTGGPVGSTRSLSGGGFAADVALTITWSGGSVCAGAKSDGSGTFSCAFVLPATPAGSYTVIASDGKGDTASVAFTVEPTLSVDPTYGDPGTSVTVNGTGFGSLVNVTVRYASNGSAATACTPTTGATGEFQCVFALPGATVGGVYTFTAIDGLNDEATATFVVTYLHASPAKGPEGTEVALTAGGFAPGTDYTLSWGGKALPSGLCSTTTITASGTLSCLYSVGYRPSGPRAFSLVDADADTATAAFAVTTVLSVSPTHLEVRSKASFALTGFAAASHVDVNWSNGTVVCALTTSANGAANCTLTLPAVPAGTYSFSATDGPLAASTLFTVLPSLALRPTSGVGGSSVAFTGFGFGNDIGLSVTSSLGTACNLKTDVNGTFTCGYVVPYAPSGTYVFEAADGDSNTATVSFQIGPVLNISEASATVGTLLAFSGTGFAAGATANVTWASGLACDGKVGTSGGFSCSFTVPAAPAGGYTFTARDYAYPVPPKGHVGNTAAIGFQLLPSLTLDPASAIVGATIEADGFGFPAGKVVYVNDSTSTLCTGKTDASGTLGCSFPTPAIAGGAHTLTAAASPSESASATLTVEPWLALLPTAGPVGAAVLLDASGLPGSASVKFTWSGGTACAGAALADGIFDCSYAVPATPAGDYTFSAMIGSTTVATATFQVEPALAVAPNAGPVGTRAAFAATGFGASESISITSSLGATCGGTTGAAGSFYCNYTVPSTANGIYTFTALDHLDNQATAAFDVGAVLVVAPDSGPVGSPLGFTGTGFSASTAIAITWSGGTICSGKTGPAGGYSCNTTMPAAPFGPQTFTATAGPSAAASFAVTPSLLVAPLLGADGAQPTFTGAGFPAATVVTVTWPGSTSCQATSNASGGFSCSLLIPAGTAGGVYPFTAADAADDHATTSFEVVTGLTVSPTHGPATTGLSFAGTNFADDATYNVTWSGGSTVFCTGTTSGTGGFTCSSAIPAATPGGTYTFTATDHAGNTASVLFTVTSLTVAPTGVAAGASVVVSGAGFQASESFTVVAPWGTVCNGTADATGAVGCTVRVPVVETPGEVSLTANDSFGDLASASFGIFTISTPTAAPATVDVGESVTFGVVASGGTSLTYAWSGLPANCSATTASFSCRPSAAVTGAAITVRVTDTDGFSVASPALSFTVDPAPLQGPPTASPGEGDVDVAVTFTADVHGGSGGGSYSWSASAGLACTLGSGPTIDCAPGTSGTYYVAYNWTDSNGVTAAGTTVRPYVVGASPTQGPATASRASADAGQAVRFTSSVVGGSPGGTYAWSASAGLDCAASTGSSLNCTPAHAGTYHVAYNWTDGAGVAATGSTALTYTVVGDPSVGTPTATVSSKLASSADVGQGVTFATTASGGAGGYSYRWSDLPAGCTGAGASFACTPSAAVSGAAITVTVTDANDFNVTSSVLTFTVYTDPTVGPPAASPTAVDDGHSVTFSVSAGGGSGGLTYVWSGLPTGCTGAGASFACTPDMAGTSRVVVNVTDSDGFEVSSPVLTFTVYPLPQQSPAKPTRPSADVGQLVNFTAQVSGGAGGGSYAWSFGSGLGCTATDGPQLNCTALSEGTLSVSYAWTDALGVAAGGGTTLGFTVFSDPGVGTPTASVGSLDVGQAVTFSATPSGGSGGYTYLWTSSAPALNCSASTTASVVCHPSAAGSYTVSVTVTDSNLVSASAGPSPTVIVAGALTVAVPNPNHPAADAEQTVMFMTSATGGTGTVLFTWSAPTALGCGTTQTATLVCVPETAGTYTVSVYATDANDDVSATETSAKFVVSTVPTITVPAAQNTSADIGQRITFHTTASGGTGTYTFTWGSSVTLSALGCTASTTDALVCIPETEGSYVVSVYATDSNGASTSTANSANFPVYVDPTVTAPTTPSKGADAGVSVSVDFTTTASGGTGHYSYTWTVPTALGCIVRPAPAIACVPLLPGTYTVTVAATDGDGVTSTVATSAPFTVDSAPTIVVHASPTSFLQGHKVTITGVVTGGSGSFTFEWSGLPSGCAAPSGDTLTCTPKVSGDFAVGITVTDTNKGTAFDNVTIDVKPSFLGLPAEEGYIILAALLIAGVAVGVFFHLRNERRRAREVQHEF